jgi:hypothetical protein
VWNRAVGETGSLQVPVRSQVPGPGPLPIIISNPAAEFPKLPALPEETEAQGV